jgi:hypothetical protein
MPFFKIIPGLSGVTFVRSSVNFPVAQRKTGPGACAQFAPHFQQELNCRSNLSPHFGHV